MVGRVWKADEIQDIRKLARNGIYAKNIAKVYGVSVAAIWGLAHRNHIKLERDPSTYRKGKRETTINREINDAITLLRENGYKVVMP